MQLDLIEKLCIAGIGAALFYGFIISALACFFGA